MELTPKTFIPFILEATFKPNVIPTIAYIVGDFGRSNRHYYYNYFEGALVPVS